ncbi:hypothetical protein HU200_067274 [Digitaria exilis]|uniref:Uncharacterized protein n=1 Tax=Digitaria exilis TaxID=1010633 RepID=A0A835DSF4_9POAL|nr:hypothetical protein HU200_067274 [Digitaria exilis]
MEGIVYGARLNLIDNMLVQGETYDFRRVAFAHTYDHPRANIFHLYSDYYVLIGTDNMINEPSRTVFIPECPRTFRQFEDVYQQPQNTFVDVIGLIVHVTKIYDRNGRRPARRVVIINERGNVLTIYVTYKLLVQHLSAYQKASSKFLTLAALHVKKDGTIRGATTTEYNQLVFSPVCNQTWDLQRNIL